MRVRWFFAILVLPLVFTSLSAQTGSNDATIAASVSVSAPSQLVPQPVPKASAPFYAAGRWYLSPRVTIAGVEGSATAFGASVERALSAGDGRWGIAVNVDHFAYDDKGFDGAYTASTSVTPIGIMGNYHFATANPRLDPFVGIGLGYQTVSVSVKAGGYSASATANSGTYWQAQAGVRFALTDAFAIGVEGGAGVGALGITGTLRF